MKDEIKTILESSRKIIKSNRENGFDRIIMLGDDIDKLLDYITNLQEENKNLRQINEEHRKLNGELREENERLTRTVVSYDETLLKRNNEYEDYKTRNEKAINCINHYATENDDYSKLYSTEEEELLEILQGSDE